MTSGALVYDEKQPIGGPDSYTWHCIPSALTNSPRFPRLPSDSDAPRRSSQNEPPNGSPRHESIREGLTYIRIDMLRMVSCGDEPVHNVRLYPLADDVSVQPSPFRPETICRGSRRRHRRRKRIVRTNERADEETQSDSCGGTVNDLSCATRDRLAQFSTSRHRKGAPRQLRHPQPARAPAERCLVSRLNAKFTNPTESSNEMSKRHVARASEA